MRFCIAPTRWPLTEATSLATWQWNSMAKCLDISGAAPRCTSCTAGASTTKRTTLLAGDSCQDSTRVRRKPFWQGVQQELYIAMICGTCSYCKSCDCSLMDVRYISILVIIKMIWYLQVLRAWLSLSKVYHRSVSLNCCVYLRIVLHHVLCGLPEIRSEIFCCSLSQPEVVFKAGSVPAIPEWQETGSCFAFFFRSVLGLAVCKCYSFMQMVSKPLSCP